MSSPHNKLGREGTDHAPFCLKPILWAIPIAVLLGGFFMPAAAQRFCVVRNDFVAFLARAHQETPRAMGMTTSGRIIELLVSDKGSFTIIVTSAEGIACLIFVGEGWQTILPTMPPTKGEKS